MSRLLTLIACTLFIATGCEKEGPMESAGESIDEAVEDLADRGVGAMQEAGEAVDTMRDDAEDAMNDAAESVDSMRDDAESAMDEAAMKLAAARGAFRADQFELEGNRQGHYRGTAAEIWAQSGGTVTAFCDFAGSGGTFAGCASYFREQDPGVRCYVVEPKGAAALSGEEVSRPDHPIQGGGYAMKTLAQLADIEPDGYLQVSSKEAIDCTRRLAREEGIFAGFSSGANLSAALQLLGGPLPGATVTIIACDSGLKYLSTDLWRYAL